MAALRNKTQSNSAEDFIKRKNDCLKMNLSDKAVQEFKGIFKKEYRQDLIDAEVREQGHMKIIRFLPESSLV